MRTHRDHNAHKTEGVAARAVVEMTTTDSWVGWGWRRNRWVRLCQAASVSACSAELSKAADAAGIPDGRTVLTRGGAPVGPPPGRRTT